MAKSISLSPHDVQEMLDKSSKAMSSQEPAASPTQRAESKRDLTLQSYVPCWEFTLCDVLLFGVVTKDLAKRIAGDRKLNDVEVNVDLVARLHVEGVRVPEDKIELFGDRFSKGVQYNTDLARLVATPRLTRMDGASPEFLAVFGKWYENFTPIRLQFWHTRKQVLEDAKAKNHPPYLGWVVGSYILEQIEAKAQKQTVAPILRSFMITWSNLYAQAAAMHPSYAKLFGGYAQELRLLADNTHFIYEAFRSAIEKRSVFVETHKPLAKAIAALYITGNYKDEIKAHAQAIVKFVEDPIDMSR